MAVSPGLPIGMPVSGIATPAEGVPQGLAKLPVGALVSGTVIGHNGAGQVLLRTVAGTLAIAGNVDMARGSVVSLRVRGGSASSLAVESVDDAPAPAVSARPSAGTSPGAPPRPAVRDEGPVALSREWPDLREAVAVLRRANQGAAGATAERAVPAPGANLAGAVLFFLSALMRGNLVGWLGHDAVKLLEDQGQAELVGRLSARFRRLARLAGHPAPGDWQALFVPLLDGEAVRQLRLFIRRRRRGRGAGEGDHGTRFVIELELSRIGDLQLDGLVRERRFDLVLRSHRALSDIVRCGVTDLFADGLAATGLSGGLAFQVAERFPVAPMEEILTDARGGIVA